MFPKKGKDTYVNWGLAYRRMSYDYWRRMILTGARGGTTSSGYWDGRYWAVLDITDISLQADCKQYDSRDPQGGNVPRMACSGSSIPSWSRDPKKFQQDTTLQKKIRDVVIEDLKDEGLIEENGKFRIIGASQDWQDLLKGTVLRTIHPVGPPYGGRGFYYYLVEMIRDGTSPEEMPVVVLVSPCDGDLHIMEMAAIEKGGTTAIKFAPPKLAHESITADDSRPVELEVPNIDPQNPSSQLYIVKPGKDDAKITDPNDFALVWEPARGALSPYVPFYRYFITFVDDHGRQHHIPQFARADFWEWKELFALDPLDPSSAVKTDIFRKYRAL
jgi:hypothetical protein